MTQQTAAPKYCVNCKNYKPYYSADDRQAATYSRCATDLLRTNVGLTYVDGRPLEEEYNYCEFLRRPEGKCGPEGKLFEPAQVTEAA